jgi:uncharacterized protein
MMTATARKPPHALPDFACPMLVDDIKQRITTAMKSGDTVARDILRLALGEIQTAEARKNATASEEEAVAAVRKLIKSNEETLSLLGKEGTREEALRKEIEVLAGLLPKQLSVDDIVAALTAQHDTIASAKNDGQATGIAMKHLKASGLSSVSGTDVTAAVRVLRKS